MKNQNKISKITSFLVNIDLIIKFLFMVVVLISIFIGPVFLFAFLFLAGLEALCFMPFRLKLLVKNQIEIQSKFQNWLIKILSFLPFFLFI
jgi:hypothetical protein